MSKTSEFIKIIKENNTQKFFEFFEEKEAFPIVDDDEFAHFLGYSSENNKDEKTKIEDEINYDATDENGNSLLLLALANKNESIIRFLLEKGVRPHSKSEHNKLLKFAVKRNLPEILDMRFFEKDLIKARNFISFIRNAIKKDKEYAVDFFEKNYPNEFKQIAATIFYQENVSNMSKMIVLGLEDKVSSFSPLQGISRITNHEGYKTEKYPENFFQNGKSIQFEYEGKNFPIGYDVFFRPDNVIKYFVIEIYGGDSKEDLKEVVTKIPDAVKLLTHKECAVVRLILPDLLQEKSQLEIDEVLHGCIHAGIHSFCHTIKNEPGKINEYFENIHLEEIKIFLYGQSFGGRTVIRHSQLYKDADGCISHGAALIHEGKDLPIITNVRKRKYDYPEVLEPSKYIDKMETPLLLLQNRDDNNTNILGMLDFYEKLKKHGKHNLARLCFFEKGGPAGDKLFNKGHGISLDEVRYWDTIFNFIEKGPSKVPELHLLSFLLQARYAKQFFRDFSYEERFLALAHQKFHREGHHKYHANREVWDKIWEEQYRPLFLAIRQVHQIIDKNDASQEFKFLLDNDLVTDKEIKRALKNHAKIVKELLKETKKIEISEEDVVDNPEIISFYRTNFSHIKDEIFFPAEHIFIIENLLLANPELACKINKNQPGDQNELKNAERQCKEAFELKIEEIKKAKAVTWRATAVVTRKKQFQSIAKAYKAHDTVKLNKIFRRAIKQRDLKIVKSLLELGCDPNLVDQHGNTMLHLALQNEWKEVYSMLIQHGARIDTANKEGKIPLDYDVSLEKIKSTFEASVLKLR